MAFTAAFDSDCENCDAPVAKGDEARMIDYDKGLVAHVTCPSPLRSQPVCSKCCLVHAKAQEDCE